MLLNYIQAALERAHYELIEDEEPFYGEVSELAGVWATGKTLEVCRRNLTKAIGNEQQAVTAGVLTGVVEPPAGN